MPGNQVCNTTNYLGTLPEVFLLNFREHLRRIPPVSMRARITETINEADICSHQIIIDIIKCMQWNTAVRNRKITSI
jgi:hypothetical protein